MLQPPQTVESPSDQEHTDCVTDEQSQTLWLLLKQRCRAQPSINLPVVHYCENGTEGATVTVKVRWLQTDNWKQAPVCRADDVCSSGGTSGSFCARAVHAAPCRQDRQPEPGAAAKADGFLSPIYKMARSQSSFMY